MTERPPRPAAANRQIPWLGYAFAAAGTTLFAAKGIIVKLAYARGIDALTLLTLRMALSVPIYVVVGLLSFRSSRRSSPRRLGRSEIGGALAIGVIGYWFSSYADFRGLETLTPQFERLILFTYPLFVVLLGALVFGQPARWKSIAAFGVSYLGLAVIFVADLQQIGAMVVTGTLWVGAAALTFALYQLLAKGGIAAMGAPLFTSVAMVGASAVVLAQYAFTHPWSGLLVSPELLTLSVILALGATVVPSYLMSAALSRISAQANSTIGTLSPVVTLLLAVLILGEPIRLVDVIGTALVIAGLALFTLVERRG